MEGSGSRIREHDQEAAGAGWSRIRKQDLEAGVKGTGKKKGA